MQTGTIIKYKGFTLDLVACGNNCYCCTFCNAAKRLKRHIHIHSSSTQTALRIIKQCIDTLTAEDKED